jgi:hypothetical protein
VSSNGVLLFNKPFNPIAAKTRLRVNAALGTRMPKHFPVDGEVFGLHVARASSALGNVSLRSIAFHNNYVAAPSKPTDRCTIRSVSVFRCEHWACSAHGVLFEDVTVEDIRGSGTARSFLWGCVYSRVVLQGWISGLLFRWQVDPNDLHASKRFLISNRALYESIEWALDITEAKFSFLQCLTGIPPQLVRLNPQVHFVLKHQAAVQLLSGVEKKDVWSSCAEELIESGMDAVVIAVGGSGAKQRLDIQQAYALRAQGLLQ